MLRRGIALLLTLMLLMGMMSVGVAATEEEAGCQACQAHMVSRHVVVAGETQIGQMLLSSGVNVALEYPNNPPAHVDTAEEKAAWIADQCRKKGITDPWQIALWLHDWLIYNADYDCTYSIYTADGVLLQGTGVCDSYTRAYNLLLQQFGIECIRLSAGEMNHAWNLVKIDGQWCHIDVTWDDPIDYNYRGGYENHNYFGLTDARMDKDHDWNRSNPQYPPCTSDINYYPVRMGLGFTTKQELEDLLNQYAEEKREMIELYYLGNDQDFPISQYFLEWVQEAYRKYIITSCSYSLGENSLKVYLTYPGQSGGSHIHHYEPSVYEPSCTTQGYTKYICDCDDYYIDDYVNPLGHTGGTATCAQKAVCTRCDSEYGELKTDNHAGGMELRNKKTPTCTEPGYTGDTYCTGCGIKIGEGEILNPAGHVEQPIPTVPATCTKPGAAGGKQCYVCGDILEPQSPLPATGHQDKNKDYRCDTCYAKLCTNHRKETIPAIPAGCTSLGATEGACCGICGEILVAQEIIPAIGHNWTEATCTTPKVCTRCYQSSGSAKGHSWKNATCLEPRTCTTCGETSGKAMGHYWKKATCTTPKTCIICLTTVGTAGHTYAHAYDYKCDVCNEERIVDMTRPMMNMYRMYDPNSGEHFYTGSEEERDYLMSVGWNYELIGFTFPLTTGKPVHRLYDPVYGEHLYTMDEEEKNMLLAAGWNYEGVAFNSGFENEVPQYRLHNPNAKRGAYHFTASLEERAFLLSIGWEDQGIGWYSLGG